MKGYCKCFFNEKDGKFYRTLEEAKAQPYPAIFRMWVQNSNPEVTYSHLVFAYGTSVTSVKVADLAIESKINQGTKKQTKNR